METISITTLHERTSEYVRKAAKNGEIYVTDRGKTVAKIVPEHRPPAVPYFARRKLTPAFRRLQESGKLRRGRDSTDIISEGREERGS
jgi:prevent-host-death family protein